MSNKIVHKKHYQKLIDFIHSETSVQVHLDPKLGSLKSSSNCWDTIQFITIGTNDRPELVLMSMAHELGHCLSVQRGSYTTACKNKLYHMGIVLPKTDRRNLLSEEQISWTLGFRFLKKHGLPITDHMQYGRRLLINHHRKHLKLKA